MFINNLDTSITDFIEILDFTFRVVELLHNRNNEDLLYLK